MRCLKSLLMVVVSWRVRCRRSFSPRPAGRNAASKATGDMIGRPAPVRAAMAPAVRSNRSFSYAPAPATAPAPRVAAPIPAPPVQAAPAAPVRRYSYQPQAAAPRYYRSQPAAQPGYLRVDKKILGY